METALDLSRARETPRGVGYRRWVIVSTGLRRLLGTRFFRGLLIVAWTAGAGMGALGFAFSQTVASGGWLEQIAASLGVRAQALAQAAGALVLLYPDICVNGFFTLVFWLQSFLGLWFCLIALTVLVPRLVALDRASNALVIYLARPLTTVDYLLGKLGIVAGLLALLWTGPLLFGWALGMVFASSGDFLAHSLGPLSRALLFNGVALVVLAAVALGVSALTRSSRNAILAWLFLWIVAGSLADGPRAPEWLRRASFTHNLAEVRKSVLRLDTAFVAASTVLPLPSRDFADGLRRGGEKAAPTNLPGALGGLGLFVVASSAVFLRRMRPE